MTRFPLEVGRPKFSGKPGKRENYAYFGSLKVREVLNEVDRNEKPSIRSEIDLLEAFLLNETISAEPP